MSLSCALSDPNAKLKKRHPRHCYLFSDVLLVTKTEKSKYAVKMCLKLTDCAIVDKRYTSTSGLEFDVIGPEGQVRLCI